MLTVDDDEVSAHYDMAELDKLVSTYYHAGQRVMHNDVDKLMIVKITVDTVDKEEKCSLLVHESPVRCGKHQNGEYDWHESCSVRMRIIRIGAVSG